MRLMSFEKKHEDVRRVGRAEFSGERGCDE